MSKLLAESLGVGRRGVLIAGAVACAMLALLTVGARARAAETIYWDNYNAIPPSIAFANIDGSGGGVLDLSGAQIDHPEGMAYDPANGRLYVAGQGNDKIVWAAIDGSGGGVLDTGVAPVHAPSGIAVDPKTQTVYWANRGGDGLIGYASAEGGNGGTLNTAGAEADKPYKVALDAMGGRLYWINGSEFEGEVFYANLDGTGGGALSPPGAEPVKQWSAINVDPVAGRLYILFYQSEPGEAVRWINLSGVGGGVVDTAGAAVRFPFGLAFDPALGRLYWANFSLGREGAFGTATPAAGGAGGIDVATAPVSSPQDPVVLKSPTASGAPRVSASDATLSCSRGDWAADHPGSYVYGAPDSYAFQWAKDGRAIAGATGSSYVATAPGSYACTVTATNRIGSASQTSVAAVVVFVRSEVIVRPEPTVAPAPTAASLTLKLTKKKAVKAKAGKVALVKLDVANGGGTASGAVKVCAELTKKVRKGLVAPKCASVGSVPAGRTAVARLRVKTKKSAKGLYRFTVRGEGATVNSVTAKVRVIRAEHRHEKHEHRRK